MATRRAVIAASVLGASIAANGSAPATATTGSTTGGASETAAGGGWLDVQAGGFATCGIRTNASSWCWGSDENGEVGDGDRTGSDQRLPVHIGRRSTWASVSLGHLHACALGTDHSLWCWGENSHGRLGDGSESPRWRPVQIASETQWASVSAGQYHTCAVSLDGVGWCWGWNPYGELGVGANGDGRGSTTPVQVSGDYQWSNLAAGEYHTCGGQVDGSLWCWRNGWFGQLGNGRFGEEPAPTYPSR